MYLSYCSLSNYLSTKSNSPRSDDNQGSTVDQVWPSSAPTCFFQHSQFCHCNRIHLKNSQNPGQLLNYQTCNKLYFLRFEKDLF